MKTLLSLVVAIALLAVPQSYAFGLRGDYSTATASAGAATLSKTAGLVTSEALTTAAAAAYTLTLTNTQVTTSSLVPVTVENGTNTQGIPVVGTVTPGSGSVVIKIYNLHASQALNGTLKIRFAIAK